ncbi:MRN complex-interacting protein isoform X1 [Salvelinus namaycush]|uniref:MRN complex-interacting protein isoform X1 n=1 Tax=Salvelinus namaycush TaxID=8040 RepID=A0A8U1F1F6_SALNM|nr:MRN complex-interacting protein isoform X1 [Salvelinus namaycush]
MVQEFHVLRCCSCQTYQVQQVKKSKKWNCKLCGEKQSVIKEFGRGSGVDCRRHVQKANARRGEILEEQDQKAWSRWEEVDDVAEEEVVEKAQECCDQNAEEANGSRWSKYLQTSDEGAGQEQAEEENVYMDRNHLQGNINVRKRKRGRGENEGRGYHSGEEDTMPPTQGWRTKGKSANPPQHNRPPSSLAPVQWSPKQSTPCRPPVPAYSKPHTVIEPPSTTSSKLSSTSVPYRANAATTSQPSGSSGTAVSQTSKWAQFLTASPEEDETNWSGSTTHMEFQTAGSMFSNVVLKHQNYIKASFGQPACSGISKLAGLGGGSGFLGKSTRKTFDRLKSTIPHYGFGQAAESEGGPAHMTLPEESEAPVCHQPPPTKHPCPTLSLGTLFYTDDDFDDTF